MKSFNLLLLANLALLGNATAQEKNDIFSYKAGDCEIYLLTENEGNGNNSNLIGATPEMQKECMPNNTYPNAVNAFLVKTPEKIILVDAGFGTKLFDKMKLLNVLSEQVDAVLITHMHGDHIGGMLKNNSKTFPKADIYLSVAEHNYWANNPKGQAREVIALYKDKIKQFTPNEIDDDFLKLFPEISAIAAPGHTPGHTMFLIESQKEQMLIWGDLTHAMAIQIPYPQVAVTYDTDPNQAIESRKKVLEYVANEKIPIAGMHISYPGMGEVSKNTKEGYLYKPLK